MYLFTFTVYATTTDREGKEREKEGLESLNVMNGRENTRLIHQGCTISVTTATEKKETDFSIIHWKKINMLGQSTAY